MYKYSSKKASSEINIAAEIGCNHKGNLEIAFEMIKVAALFCEVDIIKLQKRTPKELLSEVEYNSPHPVKHNAFGNTYGEHREYLEFTKEQHIRLKDYCEEFDLSYSTSVWDLTSAKEIISIEPDHIKIPSAINTNFNLIQYLCDNYYGTIHLSIGMTTLAEEEAIMKLFVNNNRAKDLVLYSCTSGYPVPAKDACLLEISRLQNKYGSSVKAVGFSGHHKGIALDIAAITLGAKWVERHYTLDRTWKGTDHAASLEPDGLRKLCRNIRSVEKALTYKEKEILDIEKEQRKKLKWESTTNQNRETQLVN